MSSSNLSDIMAYLCEKYPTKSELSNARLTKMVYLADWTSALERGGQMSTIAWEFDHYGPFVYDVLNTATENGSKFQVTDTVNMFGGNKQLISIKGNASYPSLNKDDKEILDYVIERTRRLSWNEFIQLVYATYPIKASRRYTRLRLGKLAQQYLAEQADSDEDDE